MRQYFVYILSSYSRALYIGVTSDLEKRVGEHKEKSKPGFTSRYNIDRLVYFESYREVREAIAREKQLKKWARAKKVKLIQVNNPQREDLSVTP